MASKPRLYKQDLPPKGGYAPVNFQRIPAKKVVYGAPLIVGFVIYEVIAHMFWIDGRRRRTRDLTEERSAQLALEPLLAAERDRALCKTARIARDAEEEVMKDVEGWEVGTWFGHKVFKTIDNPFPYAHASFYYNNCRPYAARAEMNESHTLYG